MMATTLQQVGPQLFCQRTVMASHSSSSSSSTNAACHNTRYGAWTAAPCAGGRAISRADVAAVCVEALSNPAAHRVTLELAAAPPAEGAPPAPPLKDQLSGLWKGLVADP